MEAQARLIKDGREPSPSAQAPLAVDARGLGRLLGVAERTVRTMNSAGRIPRPVALGRRRVWCVSEVLRWLEAGAPERARWEAMRAGGGR